MKIKCCRPVITKEGITDVVYFFDTETLEIEFDEKYLPLLVAIYKGEAQDIPESGEYKKYD